MEERKGRRPGSAMFKQLRDNQREYTWEPMYDMDEFHATFLEEMDVTEYKAALKLVGSWEEWERIKSASIAFSEYVEAWVDEVQVAMASDAIEKIYTLIDKGSPSTALSAAKFLSQKSYEIRKGAGRPSNAEVQAERKRLAIKASDTDDDAERVLRVMNGGK